MSSLTRLVCKNNRMLEEFNDEAEDTHGMLQSANKQVKELIKAAKSSFLAILQLGKWFRVTKRNIIHTILRGRIKLGHHLLVHRLRFGPHFGSWHLTFQFPKKVLNERSIWLDLEAMPTDRSNQTPPHKESQARDCSLYYVLLPPTQTFCCIKLKKKTNKQPNKRTKDKKKPKNHHCTN
jgi:hypothetical protein